MHTISDSGALAERLTLRHQAHMPRASAKPKTRKPHFIRAWRRERGMTLEALGEAIGMTSQNLGRIERGEIAYTQDTIEAVAAALRCSVVDLLTRDPEAPAAETAGQPVSGGIPPEVAKSVLQWVYRRLDMTEHEAALLAQASVLVMQQSAQSEAGQTDPSLIQARVETAFGMLHSTRQ